MKVGWKEVRLGEIADVQSGGTPLISNKQLWHGGVPWYSSGELNNTFTTDPERTISVAGLEKSNAKLFPAGSLLIGMYDTAALKMSILDRAAAFNQAIAGVKPNDQIDIRFVFHALNSIKEELLGRRRGVRQKNLSLGKVRDFEVPFPSLTEQQRIVNLLDDAFDGIATAKANAEKNLQNARTIFESHLQSVFTQRGDGWQEAKEPLSSLCELIVDCEHKTAPTQAEGIPSIRTPNIGKGNLLLDGVYRVSEATYTEWTRRAEPRAGDLIFAREAPAGNVGVVPPNLRVCLGQRTVLIRPKRSVFVPEFLALLLLCPEMQKTLLGHSRGATVQHVNMKDIRALNVGAIPSISLQSRIVETIGAVTEETQRLESIYLQKLTALDDLKKSLLHRAFTGAL
ncbi:restriction endonuclease subunit S [Rhodoferax ferrireducens]|uniref:restriction endonuclease subunit S n=1 Tax=Rhodoferax ferrireducens TaxID=192843 RepID=UPI000E0D096C|nr:restriction endonuclease subunit S [Rhodoferax ferrireducens]